MQFAINYCGVTLQLLNLIRKIIHAEIFFFQITLHYYQISLKPDAFWVNNILNT